MARILEYQCKRVLSSVGIKVPRGSVAGSPDEAASVADAVGGPVVLKAQIPVTGRMKLGAIKFASNPREAYEAAAEMFSKAFAGFRVKRILVEERLDVERELYLGVVVNESYKVRSPTVMFSTEGGTDIEEVARTRPEKVARLNVDYEKGLTPEQAEALVSSLGLEAELSRRVSSVLLNLYHKVFKGYDAWSAEINPLVVTAGGELVAADCRLVMDDSSLYRHPEVAPEAPRDLPRPPTELEMTMWRWEDEDPRGTGYFVQLVTEIREGGYIGFHGIGGGGAMLAADALSKEGLKIANYADTSGDPPASKVYRVIKTILSQPGIEGYILMGAVMASQEQWHHAHAIVKALRETLKDKRGFPVLILLAGNKEEEAHEIIRRGLRDLPIRLELYGRDHIYETDFIARRMKELVESYRRELERERGTRVQN